MTGTLVPTNGALTTNDRLTLLSNASGTARVGEITGGSVSGNVTVQRYINAGSTNWRFLASPVKGRTLADWDDDFITSGYTGSDFPTFPFISIYSYVESDLGVLSNGYRGATNSTNSITPGQGYTVWSGDTSTGTMPFTIDVTGEINANTVSLPITYTDDPGQPASEDGWNLVGNPYPSSIDWNDINWTKTNVNDAIYIWDPDTEQYASYVGGVGTNGGSNIIASSQGFWVQTSGSSPALTAREGIKSSTDQPFLKEKSDLALIKIELTDSIYKDETVITINELATREFDSPFDARKLYSTSPLVPSISSMAILEERSINGLPVPDDDWIVPLKITVPKSGIYTLNITPSFSEEAVRCILLEDIQDSSTTMVGMATESIQVFLSDTLQDPRFFLHLGAGLDKQLMNASCFGSDDGRVVLSANGNGPWGYTLRDSAGSVIDQQMNSFKEYEYNQLRAGKYELIVSNSGVCGILSEPITIIEPSEINSSFSLSTASVEVGESILFENTSVNADAFFWSFGDGGTSTARNPFHHYDKSGEYEATLTASTDSCTAISSSVINVEKRKKEPFDPDLEKELTVYGNQGILFISFTGEDANSLQWVISDAIGREVASRSYEGISTLNDQFPIDRKGVYFVTVRLNGSQTDYKIPVLGSP